MHNDLHLLESQLAIKRAFSKQAEHYDEDDYANPVLRNWRTRVYAHLEDWLTIPSHILEINAGTGIDALYLASKGHIVHATDAAPGMVGKIREKIMLTGLANSFTAQECSYEALDGIAQGPFDHVFSNFGGINCCRDLSLISKQIPDLLKKEGYLTWVIMPPFCPWEWLHAIFGGSGAFRRLNRTAVAYLEGERFTTYYYSVSDVQKSLGKQFRLIKAEGLGSLSPPPGSIAFVNRHPVLYNWLCRADQSLASYRPFNRWADHLILTFQFQ